MEPFDKITVKLKSHIWCLIFFSALLIFWIVAFSVSEKGGDIASWLSILFAVVVIVYMLIQGHEMRNLVEEGHRLMAEKTGKVAEYAESISKQLNEVLKSNEPHPPQVQKTQTSGTYELHINAYTRIFTLLVLYASSQSFKLQKQMSLKEIGAIILDTLGISNVGDIELTKTAYASIGMMFGVESLLEPARVFTGKNLWDAKIENLPHDFEEVILGELTKRTTEKPVTAKYADKINSAKGNIDAYFAEL